MLIYFKLCKEGYASSVKEASQMSARTVLQALAYEKFLIDYENTAIHLMKG